MLEGVQEWLEYRSTAFGSSQGVWDGGPDFAEILSRWTADPDYVEAMLVQGIAARDPLAADALRFLPLCPDSSEGFRDLLHGCTKGSPAGFRLAAARAALEYGSDPGWQDEVVQVLVGAGFWIDRLEAARLIAAFTPTDHLIRAAATAMEDPEFLVRRQAAVALMRFGGRIDATEPDPDVLALIGSASTPSQQACAAVQLALFASVNAPSR